MKRLKTEKIHLNTINILKSNVSTSPQYYNKPVPIEDIKVGYSQESAFNFEKSLVRIRLNIQLDGLNKKRKEIGLKGEFDFEFHFHVENFDDFVEVVKGKKMVSGVLGGTLMGIVYSTARGMILEQTNGSSFNGAIIPVIDPNDLIDD